MSMLRRRIWVLVLLLAACRHSGEESPLPLDGPFPLRLPAGFPAFDTPADNPLTEASVALGKALFFEKRLSRDGSISCASCHLPARAFSDTVPLSAGVDGRTGMRNSAPLTNLAYHDAFFRDGGVPTLEQQVIAPIHDPVEMDFSITAAAALLRYEEPYRSLSQRAYGVELDAWALSRALASYERTLVSGWSRWDRWMAGEAGALSESEVRGWQLFNSAAVGCGSCHSGFDLSDHAYHNVGQYLDYADPGRGRITLDPGDEGKFKTPTLRNIARTAPYMHDGSMATLEQVVDFFAAGGLPHANRDPLMQSFALSPDDKADLIAFLRALNDEQLIDQVP
ncbi:MAG: cytochrome c peroxidase [Flavobacteriales bacterium]|jgi:cytochrome c peroxidase|nr:MAG: cytochrome c peroxidase [Flavobacteriales bacterium]